VEFVRASLGAFGALRDLDTGPEPLTRLVAILGPNEAGKSTFFHFLTAMLYGIYPASRHRNPYTPWKGGDIEGGAVLRMNDGETWEVHRRLLSSPVGTLVRDTRTEDIRNRTLPCAEHVPREVFRQVFALTLSELSALRGESWDQVQDQLITGMGATDLASLRGVIEEMHRDAGRLWRPSRVGSQKVRDLQERVRELRLRRRAAADTDGRLRAAAAEREDVETRLRQARDELEACRLFVDGCQHLLPLRDRLGRIETLRRQAGAVEELDGLPSDPNARLAELDDRASRLEKHLDDLGGEAQDPEARAEAFGPFDRRFVERSREIRDALARAAGLEPNRTRIRQLETELKHLTRRSEDTARELFSEPWGDVDPEAVLAVPVVGLRRALERYRAVRERTRAGGRAHAGGGMPTFVGPLFAVAGVLSMALAFASGRIWLAIPGALLLGVGGAFLVLRPVRRPDTGESEALHATQEILADLPLRQELKNQPTVELGVTLERLQDLLSDQRERGHELAHLRKDVEEGDEAIRALANELGEGSAPDVTVVSARRLEDRLREAEAARAGAVSARRELERLDRERQRITTELEEVRTERIHLTERLAGLSGSEGPDLPTLTVGDRIEALELARRLDDELRREYPDRKELLERIHGFELAHAGASVASAELASKKARASELTDQVEELTGRLEGLKKDMEYLGREETMGAIDGEIESIRMDIEDAVRARDRIWLVAKILREADRRFRDEHQPEVLRRAGCHLSTITGGRYERILLDETDGAKFLLDGPDYPGPIEVGEPISTGTREQVYLAIRLAILDHLDRRGERLPLFMDEAFVNWDQARRERAFGLLDEVSRTRQVFLFTCHDEMAGSLAARGARVWVLDARE